MSKYYKVYLEYENLCVICKNIPFIKNLYREIITDKIIYPKNKNTVDKLTYGYLPNGLPRCYEITNSQTKEWLCSLNKKDYVYDLERIEYIIRNSCKVEMDEKMVFKRTEKQASKDIRRILKK